MSFLEILFSFIFFVILPTLVIGLPLMLWLEVPVFYTFIFVVLSIGLIASAGFAAYVCVIILNIVIALVTKD